MAYEKINKILYVATGAYSCGKTSTLTYLRDNYGYNIHKEAHLIAIDKIKDNMKGHPEDKPYYKINNQEHFCPLCNPLEFCQMVLKEQLNIESTANNGDIIERGYIDPLEYYMRNTGESSYPYGDVKNKFSKYTKIFLFDVIPDAQKPKWGKNKEARIKEACYINERLLKIYEKDGFEVVLIENNTIDKRAKLIHRVISSIKS